MSLCVLFFLIQFSTSFGLLLNNVDITDLERIKAELKTELTKEFELKFNQLVQNLTGSLSKDDVKSVAFTAGVSHDIVNPANNQHLVFDQVITNVGQAYRPLHGIFTAPISGTYSFSLNMAIPNIVASHRFFVDIMLNNRAMGYIFFDGHHDYWLRRSDTVVLHLSKDDDVWIRSNRVGNVTIPKDFLHNHLSGFLISRD